MAKRVAVIGAGCTGLAATKSCLDENLAPTCFESSNDLGGLWRFTEDVRNSRGCVMNSTVINTSKEMMSYSDFPPPREFPNFMHHSKVLEYFHKYAERFNLLHYVHFNTEVLSVREHDGSEIKSTDQSRRSLWHDKTRSKDNITTAHDAVATKDSSTTTTSESNDVNNSNVNDKQFKENDTKTSPGPKSPKKNGVKFQGVPKGNVTEECSELLSSECDTDSTKRDQLPSVQECTGQWEIKVKDKQTAEISTHRFDCVLICTGHHADVSMPYFPGQSIFKGKIMHSRDLRRANEIDGSRHMVVGIGNSGCDAAVELSRRGKVFLSTRRGTWLMHRLQSHGLPADIAFMSRLVFATALSLPMAMLNKLTEWDLNQKVDHSLYGLRPKHGPFATHPTVNDELPNRIASGHVVMKPNIDSFTPTGVKFDDGTEEDNIDTVVMATGYKFNFPFLDQSLLTVEWNQSQLYLFMFPPKVTPPTLAVIGCIQPGGAVGPVSEMQCRLATRVFKGDVKLPTKHEMLADIEKKHRAMRRRYIDTQRHTVQVDYVPYMDEIATLIGCKPALGTMFLTDPRLAWTCVFGPCTPYQYRLRGPGAWSGAREAILTQMDRVKCPFSTRPVDDVPAKTDVCDRSITCMISLALVCFLLVILCVFWASAM